MANRSVLALTGVLGAAAVAVMAAQGCGGGGGSSKSPQALCTEGCDKFIMCYSAELGAMAELFKSTCRSTCTSQMPTSGGQPCTNQSAVIAAYESCLSKTCDQFEACLETIPECQGGSAGGGTGGASGGGTGGSGTPSGSGGSSGGSSNWSCTEQAGTGCQCVVSQAASGSCSSYECCFLTELGTTRSCLCATAVTAAQCSIAAQAAGGTVVSSCPPP